VIEANVHYVPTRVVSEASKAAPVLSPSPAPPPER
jgi:hypothetical protein